MHHVHLSRSLFSVAISELKDEKARIHKVHSGSLPLNSSSWLELFLACWNFFFVGWCVFWLAGVFSVWLESPPGWLDSLCGWLEYFFLLAGIFPVWLESLPLASEPLLG